MLCLLVCLCTWVQTKTQDESVQRSKFTREICNYNNLVGDSGGAGPLENIRKE
jgi:hypothetical protein